MAQVSYKNSRARAALAAAVAATLLACSDSDTGTATPSLEGTPGVEVSEQAALFRTEQFTLEPESEKYLCYAAEVPDDLIVDGFSVEGAPYLHHLLFSRSTGSEPEGLTECDVLFRYTWQPIFAAGSGDSELELPRGTGQRIAEGQQLVLQMHLYNSSTEPVTGSVELRMHRSSADDPEAIGNKTFGTFELSLPATQASEVEALCTIDEPVEIVAVLPHMHQLGTSLTFEVGRSEDAMELVFERDPYHFDDQRIDPVELSLEPGDMTRLRCQFENPHDREVGFGESTDDEMCFLMAFTRGEHGIGGCTLRDADAGFVASACEDVEPNERGIGQSCTVDGMECAAGLRCTAGLSGDEETGFCIAIGCESKADCGGGGATCCTPALGGGVVNICMPGACRPDDCAPVD